MVITKRINTAILILVLALIPFGQLTKLAAGFHFIDILVAATAVLWLRNRNTPKWSRPLVYFVIILAISLAINPHFTGFLYLVRFATYLIFAMSIFESKRILRHSLTIIAVFIAIFGWIQYLLLPDLTAMKYFGWDDHLYRLVSTFLDPAFTGILLVLGILATLTTKAKHKSYILVFLTITLALTFSRASFLSLGVGAVAYFVLTRNKIAILIPVLLFVTIPFLPAPRGEGVDLARTYSINQKLESYKRSIKIIKENPVFGVGFNNICKYKYEQLGVNKSSNSCNGLDNSYLFILATSGIAGFTVFIWMAYRIFRTTRQDMYGKLFMSSGLAVGVHALFTNTLFYPFVMIWMGLLLVISRVRG